MKKQPKTNPKIQEQEEQPETASNPVEVSYKYETETIGRTLMPHQIRQFIDLDPAISTVTLTLLAGKPFATTRFPLYPGYLTRIRLAYDKEQPEEFVREIRSYMIDAYKHVPHVPAPNAAKVVCDQAEMLVEKYGVRQVGRVILARMFG